MGWLRFAAEWEDGSAKYAKAFAALERREWFEPDVAGAYASGFAKASDRVVPHLVAAVEAGPDTDAPGLCRGHGNVSTGLAFDFLRGGTARGGALLRPQPKALARAIRTAVVERPLANHGEGPEWTVPMPAVVISAPASAPATKIHGENPDWAEVEFELRCGCKFGVIRCQALWIEKIVLFRNKSLRALQL